MSTQLEYLAALAAVARADAAAAVYLGGLADLAQQTAVDGPTLAVYTLEFDAALGITKGGQS